MAVVGRQHQGEKCRYTHALLATTRGASPNTRDRPGNPFPEDVAGLHCPVNRAARDSTKRSAVASLPGKGNSRQDVAGQPDPGAGQHAHAPLP